MKKFVVSKTAIKSSIVIGDYIEAKFSFRRREEFIEKLKSAFIIIQNNPESFPVSEINSNHYRFVLTKQTTIYYKFNNTEIRILALFDTRKNPSKIHKIK
jgi:plasmid stabilization system protein ParE